MKTVPVCIGIGLCTSIGAGIGFALAKALYDPNPWQQLERYQAFVGNPDNLSWDDAGFGYLPGSDIPKIDGALGRLVDTGEVEVSTFVIPNANLRSNRQKWMVSDLFLWAFGPIQDAENAASESSDLVFTAWYRPEDWEQIQAFLGEMHRKSDPSTAQPKDASPPQGEGSDLEPEGMR